MVTITINGQAVEAPEGTSVLDAATAAGVTIPTLCYLKDLNCIGSCRVCLVDVEGEGLAASCNTAVREGMVVRTDTPQVAAARRANLQAIMDDHRALCATCVRQDTCALRDLASTFNLADAPGLLPEPAPWDADFPLQRDSSKCIKCMRCVAICEKVQHCAVWDFTGVGPSTKIIVRDSLPIAEAGCALCGQCITHCPTGALTARDDVSLIMEAILDPAVETVVQVAPAVRTAWGEGLGLSREEATPGRLAAALHAVGFDKVFDTDFAADLTIMEEGTELLGRLNAAIGGDKGVKLPLMTSCCPGWVSFMEKHFPELADNLSTAKSPQQMFGAIAKNYFAQKLGIDRKDLVVVSVMPCVAKKAEAARPEFSRDGDPDVNISITTRELAHMIRFANMDFALLEEDDFDRPLGESTGAGVIFGATGGVIEAAVRTAYEVQTKKPLDRIDFTELRGMEGVRSATVDFDGTPVRIGIAHGLANARQLIREVVNGTSPYHAIEIMACPGGCIGGGGQPYHRGDIRLLQERTESLYAEDAHKPLRKSHENPYIQSLYRDFLGEPCGHLSHELLHTRYYNRKPVVEPCSTNTKK